MVGERGDRKMRNRRGKGSTEGMWFHLPVSPPPLNINLKFIAQFKVHLEYMYLEFYLGGRWV